MKWKKRKTVPKGAKVGSMESWGSVESWSGEVERWIGESQKEISETLICSVWERERERETERQSERHTDRERRGMNVVRGNRERERREREVSGTLLVTGCLQLWICPSLLLRNWSLKVFVCLGSYVALLLAAFTAISFKKQKQNKKNIIIILKVTTFHYYK